MSLICSVLVAVIFYKLGIKSLFRSRILADKNADLIAYASLMLSGVTIAQYITIEFIPYLFHPSYWEFVFIATLASILTGEYIYYRNFHLIKRALNQ